MLTNKQIIQKIQKAKKVAIFSHVDPDPDAFGAMLGFRDFCHELAVAADAFSCKHGDFVSYIFPVEQFKKDFKAEDYDLIALLDFHAVSRGEKDFVSELEKCKNFVVIDHHMVLENEIIPKNYRIIKKASASQLVLDLYREMGRKPSKETATYLYAGIIGDTDRFLHVNLSEEVFDDAKFLLQCGADAQLVYDKMFRSITTKEISLMRYFYANISYLRGGKVAYIVFTNKDMKKLNCTMEEIKMFSNTLINVKGVKWSFLVYERASDRFSFSMRSARELDLIPIACKMGGGGHKNAAAFIKDIKPSKIKKLIESLASEVFDE